MDTLIALAEAHEAAAEVLRRHAALASANAEPAPADAVTRARAVHPQLGPRQAEAIRQLEEAGPSGTNTGAISRAMAYEQSNVYLTLRGLITLGFVERDESASPHRYFLTDLLWHDPPGE